jgi:hypothetical protein
MEENVLHNRVLKDVVGKQYAEYRKGRDKLALIHQVVRLEAMLEFMLDRIDVSG